MTTRQLVLSPISVSNSVVPAVVAIRQLVLIPILNFVIIHQLVLNTFLSFVVPVAQISVTIILFTLLFLIIN